MYFSALLAFTALLATSFAADCDIKKFEDTTRKVAMISDPDLVIPTNDAELDTHCSDMNANLKSIKEFSNDCATALGKSIIDLTVFEAKKELKRRCKTKEGRAEFLKHIACAKDNGFEKSRMCRDNLIAQLEYIASKVDDQHRTLTTCCAFHQMHDCLLAKVGEACDSKTGPETKEYIDKVISGAVTETMEFACAKYRNLEECNLADEKVIWDKVMEIGKDPVAAGFPASHTSVIEPMIEIINSLAGQ